MNARRDNEGGRVNPATTTHSPKPRKPVNADQNISQSGVNGGIGWHTAFGNVDCVKHGAPVFTSLASLLCSQHATLNPIKQDAESNGHTQTSHPPGSKSGTLPGCQTIKGAAARGRGPACLEVPASHLESMHTGVVQLYCLGCHKLWERELGEKHNLKPYYGFYKTLDHQHMQYLFKITTVIVHIYCKGIDTLQNNPACVCRAIIKPYLAPTDFLFVEEEFNVGTKDSLQAHWNKLMELEKRITCGHFANKLIFVTTHSDIVQGDLFTGNDEDGVSGNPKEDTIKVLQLANTFGFTTQQFQTTVVAMFITTLWFDLNERLPACLQLSHHLGSHTNSGSSRQQQHRENRERQHSFLRKLSKQLQYQLAVSALEKFETPQIGFPHSQLTTENDNNLGVLKTSWCQCPTGQVGLGIRMVFRPCVIKAEPASDCPAHIATSELSHQHLDQLINVAKIFVNHISVLAREKGRKKGGGEGGKEEKEKEELERKEKERVEKERVEKEREREKEKERVEKEKEREREGEGERERAEQEAKEREAKEQESKER
ncbi:hypothetical protein HYDPIDRAFT_169248 [Hydnomerulius pinastri MD-312]|uniref:Unplaced genomic scaffold scaffold_23, whole genome shotgun sequence n=1 Tax=Hydnomerulius pinastri MD-312 TaxID=994086 RepID=A0A0C9WD02_9AGAM|nr:hypothetical protein HYDPIDRAFT_169248 [Hydnomerulius pinastri MD-312]